MFALFARLTASGSDNLNDQDHPPFIDSLASIKQSTENDGSVQLTRRELHDFRRERPSDLCSQIHFLLPRWDLNADFFLLRVHIASVLLTALRRDAYCLVMTLPKADGQHDVATVRPKGRFSRIERGATDPERHQRAQYEHLFHYKPLDRSKGAVRLIKVYPLGDDGRVRCRIERHHISTIPYIALSYVWGSDDARHNILLNGQIFRLRPNLYAFLRYVAKTKHFSDTLFWIDAISINQSDVSEKNGHVRHMGAIYSNARRVIAWLGHTFGPTAIRAKPPNHWICCAIFEAKDRPGRHICNWKVPARSSWEVVMHPYWSRLWIAQELELASRVDVLWNGRFYNWFRLKKHLAASVVRQRQLPADTPDTPFSINIEFIRNLPIARYFQRAEAAPLSNLVPRFALHACQIGHDHVYALLSLASDGQIFEPDYNDSAISLLLRLVSFCYAHPTATFMGKIGSALGLDPVNKGITVDLVGRLQSAEHSSDAKGSRYRLIDHHLERNPEVDTDVVVCLPDTNLHLVFRKSAADEATSDGASYVFLSRVEVIRSRIEQAKNKFGRRSRQGRNASSERHSEVKHLSQIILRCDKPGKTYRLYGSWQAVLAIFGLSETDFARGRLESRIRNWIPSLDIVQAEQQNIQICM